MSTEAIVEPVALATSEFHFDILKILLILGVAVLTTSLSELVSWLLLYRK